MTTNKGCPYYVCHKENEAFIQCRDMVNTRHADFIQPRNNGVMHNRYYYYICKETYWACALYKEMKEMDERRAVGVSQLKNKLGLGILSGLDEMDNVPSSVKGISDDSIENIALNIKGIAELDQATDLINSFHYNIARNFLYVAHTLKKVHAEKLYLSKFDSYEDYCLSVFGYKRSHSFNFLSIANTYSLNEEEKYLELGITKLLLLNGVPEEKRNQYIENNNPGEKSVKQIKEDITNIDNITPLDEIEDIQHTPAMSAEIITDNSICDPFTLIDEKGIKDFKRFGKKLDSLYTMVEKLEEKHNNSEPVVITDIKVINEMVESLESELNKVKILLKKYLL